MNREEATKKIVEKIKEYDMSCWEDACVQNGVDDFDYSEVIDSSARRWAEDILAAIEEFISG